MVWGESELGGFDVLGGELERPEGQGRSQCQRGGGRGGRGRLWGYSILGLAAKLEGICQSFFMGTNKTGQVLVRDMCQSFLSYWAVLQKSGETGESSGLTLMKSCPSSVFSFSMVDEESD